jgi:hypothetical protein
MIVCLVSGAGGRGVTEKFVLIFWVLNMMKNG